MRLSDAIAMGRTMTEHRANDLAHCAQGMALISCGVTDRIDMVREGGIGKRWPWSAELTDSDFPCGCNMGERYEHSIRGSIAHIFDLHVMHLKDWTLDELIDWVRSVEPVEAEAKEVECASADHPANSVIST